MAVAVALELGAWLGAALCAWCLICCCDPCRRPHQSLAAVGVAALTRLISAAGSAMSDDTWALCIGTLSSAALDTLPQVPSCIMCDRRLHDFASEECSGSWMFILVPAAPEASDASFKHGSKHGRGPLWRHQASSVRLQVGELVAGGSVRTSLDASASEDGEQRRPSLATGSGARRLGLVRVYLNPPN